MGVADPYNAAEDLIARNLSPARAGRAAVLDRAGEMSYSELSDAAARWASVLRSAGLRRQERVVLLLSDTRAFPIAFLGGLQAGAIPVPLNTRLTPKDYAFILADCDARAVVVSSELLPLLGPALEALELDTVWVSGASDGRHASMEGALAAADPQPDFAPTHRDEPGFFLYTSGTTGQPKGVVHAHGHLLPTADHYAIPTLGLTEDDVVFSAAKLYFAYGLGNALTFPMSIGATAVLLDGPPTIEAVSEVLRRHRPTVFYGVPTLFGMLLSRPDLLPAKEELALRVCTSAGEALPPDLLARWRAATGVDILDGLGSTEGLHIFLSNQLGDITPGASGRAVPGYDLRLVDDEGLDVPPGELGHLEVRGPSTGLGYWKRRDATHRAFRGAWLRTGDRYTRTQDGVYTYAGRSDDLMKVGGIWVSPFEVESCLVAHPAVLECAVVAKEDEDGLIKPSAHVVLAPDVEDAPELEALLIAHVRARLAPYKRPRWVRVCAELPKTATGKIQRFKLRGR